MNFDSGQYVKQTNTRVCMIVRNEVSQDARVKKESFSVAQAGFEVLVLGVRKSNTDLSEEFVTKRFRIVRVPYFLDRKRTWRYKINLAVFFALFLLLLAYVVLPGLGFGFTAFLTAIVVIMLSIVVLFVKRKSDHFQSVLRLARALLRIVLTLFIKFPITTRDMLREVIRFNPDIVHCHDIGTLRIGIAAKKRIRCKLIYDAHEIYEEAVGVEKVNKKLYRFIHRGAGKWIDGFVTINQSIAEYYSSHYPRFPKAVVVMNATRISEKIVYDGRLHAAAGIRSDQKILLFQGGFTDKRGIPVVAESAKFLPDDWSVVFMGSGKLKDLINEYANEANRGTAIKKLGVIPPAPQEELLFWTAGATIGIIPYEDYGLNHTFCTPNKLWEFPNAGVPALVTPRVEMKKMLENYRYGWVLKEPVTGQRIAKFVSSLKKNDLEQAKEACYSFISKSNWGIYEKSLLTLYGDLVSGRSEL